jgi:putative zinc finger/helix-turn-helix YgiT family protein
MTDMGEQRFPQRCPECGKGDVRPGVMPYNARAKHDGSVYTFSIAALKVNKCQSCGEIFFDNTTDDQISQGLREHLGLLSPEEIRRRLGQLGLTQKEFAERISIAPETVSRWLSGTHIQSRAYDKLMRFFFQQVESDLNNAAAAGAPRATDK